MPRTSGWPAVTTTCITPVVLLLVIAVARGDGHRGPAVVALASGALLVCGYALCARVAQPRPRALVEALTLTAVGAWLALALWAVLDHHR